MGLLCMSSEFIQRAVFTATDGVLVSSAFSHRGEREGDSPSGVLACPDLELPMMRRDVSRYLLECVLALSAQHTNPLHLRFSFLGA